MSRIDQTLFSCRRTCRYSKRRRQGEIYVALFGLIVITFVLFESTRASMHGICHHDSILVQEPSKTIPFDLDGHNINVQVKINDRPEEYRFILDTGALTMIAEGAVEELQLKKGMEMPTLDPSVKTYLTSIEKLCLGPMIVENLSVPIMNATSFFGRHFDMAGFVGSDFLKSFRFTIDYRKQNIHYYDVRIPDFLLSGYRIPFERHMMIGAPMVECIMNGELRTKGMIDTGSPFIVVLPLSFAEQLGSSVRIKSKGIIAKWPFTSPTHNYIARIDRLNLGALELRNIIALCAELPAMMSGALIGKELLSQFMVTLDYPSNELLLTPYDDATFSDNLFSTGLAVEMDENSRIVVGGFWEGSPADRAGIQVGDEILEMNSKTAKDMDISEIRGLLEDGLSREIDLRIRSKETERKIVLVKEMLFPEVHQQE